MTITMITMIPMMPMPVPSASTGNKLCLRARSPVAGSRRQGTSAQTAVNRNDLSKADAGAMCEHPFPVGSQGHQYTQFQRALKTGNGHLALAAAAELRPVDLADADEAGSAIPDPFRGRRPNG
jgi:hypothetical protein